MRINWPCVGLRRFNELERENDKIRLNCEVANSSVQHLTDRRAEYVTRMAEVALEISRLKRENAELKKRISEYVRTGNQEP